MSGFDSCLQQVNVERGSSRHCGDICSVSCGSCSIKDVRRDCEEGEQHFGWTLVSCRRVGWKRDAALK